ncbi:hypothetical protein [Roseiconus lacunae]|uniref:DNA alkylation repair protein n=1 Tax=Roseiconus lacunae TaxID=2605694 RepID=A0ABT7PSU7_9BACT|nr:hypothetical protein [Roseiconus lacunae]MDM4019354.1 hypothetical protein [Roseiconus lacunae]
MSGFSLKDHLFNRDRVEYLAKQFHSADPEFKEGIFVRQVMQKLKNLELKQRIVLIAETLEKHLSSDFRIATEQIVNALPPPLDEALADDDFGDFIFAPLGEYVVRNGRSKRHLRRSLKTLQEITKRFSMEDAIRAFIRDFPDETVAELGKWATHRNYHVRRLVSEGTRPSLPWSGKVPLAVETPIPLLDQLYADPTRYVTRSVANHLNDISKQNPDLVIATLRRWKKEKRQSSDELAWMTKHALRTLIKQGHSKTLTFLGYRTKPQIEVGDINLSVQQIHPGETLEFTFDVTAQRREALIVDYVIDFVKANGDRAGKVFKLSVTEIESQQTQTFRKRHKLHANATTFTLYPGTHGLTIQINGKPYVQSEFELLG